MGLGIVSDDDFNSQLGKLQDKINPVRPVTKPVVPTINPSITPTTDTHSGVGESNNEVTNDDIKIPEVLTTRELIARKRASHQGRKPGDVNVPLSLQRLIGETGSLDSRQEAVELAQDFGISASSASAYAAGATSTASYNQPSTPISDHVTKVKARLAKKARGKLNLALQNLTEEKLQHAKAKDISGVARDMAGVIKSLEYTDSSQTNPNNLPVNTPQIVIYAPSVVQENYFGEAIDASE
jgi:hypothetical protein